MYINRYTYEGGNPFLLPSLSHNITLGTTYKWVYLSAGYQYVKDAIISFSGAYSEDDPTIALINMINAPDYDKIFASLVLSPTMGLWSPQNKRIVCNKKLSLTAKGFNLPLCIIRKSKFPQNPKRSVQFSGKGTKRSVQKRKARNTQKAETKVL